jgi:hypothetical protein
LSKKETAEESFYSVKWGKLNIISIRKEIFN